MCRDSLDVAAAGENTAAGDPISGLFADDIKEWVLASAFEGQYGIEVWEDELVVR